MDARCSLILAALILAGPGAASAGSRVHTDDPAEGPAALARAQKLALAPSPLDRLVGAEQIFHFSKGRLYEVWTAPLRVTTISLGAGEEIISLAAGDSLRWQVAQATSGSGAQAQSHVLIKPFERGLATNLVITTDRRVYLLLVRSGEAFNAVVSWTQPPAPVPVADQPAAAPPQAAPEPEMLATRFEIRPRGRRPDWTPSSVMTDGRRTYIAFPPQIAAAEVPVLSLIDQDGASVLANYRQKGALLIVDGVIAVAELRLDAKHPEVVRITRLPEARP